MYRPDHINVLRVLSDGAADKTFKVSEIATSASFRRTDNADRRVRNAMRKLRSDGMVEIVERGHYKLLPEGAKYAKKCAEEGWAKVKARASRSMIKKATKAREKATKAREKATKAKEPAPASAKAAPPEKTETIPEVQTLPEVPGNGVGKGNDANEDGATQLTW